MTYIQGFVIPVAADGAQAYLDLAVKAAPVFADSGAVRTVECWGDDVPDGKVTDLKRAVDAQDGEHIVYSWIVWPDQATCAAGADQVMADDRLTPDDGAMPFDMKRMIHAEFDTLVDTGPGGAFGYLDGMVAPVPVAALDAYLDHARTTAAFFVEHGATRIVENWSTTIDDGTVTDFKRAVQATTHEGVMFSWIEWPDKATRNAGMGAIMADPRMRDLPMPFDGTRMIFGGFRPILDTDA